MESNPTVQHGKASYYSDNLQGRIIDLSQRGAEKIDMIGTGVVKVRVEEID